MAIQLTISQLQAVCTSAPSVRLEGLLPAMNAALDSALIDSPVRAAMWLAQWSHESFDFKYMHEIWGPTDAQKRYEPPTSLAAKLGNTEQGDGYLYRGRGFCQLTGRANYQKYGNLLGIDLIGNPDLASQPDVACQVAASFWKTHNLNKYADACDVEGATKVINGGLNGIDDRKARFKRACQALGVEQ